MQILFVYMPSGYYLKMHYVSLVNSTQLSGERQDECGIRTVPHPFFSLPNDKEKKSGLAMRDYPHAHTAFFSFCVGVEKN